MPSHSLENSVSISISCKLQEIFQDMRHAANASS